MPLSWAAGNGYSIVVHPLLKKGNIDPDLEDSRSGRTPLSWAAGNGHEVIVKLLLEIDQVVVDSEDSLIMGSAERAGLDRVSSER